MARVRRWQQNRGTEYAKLPDPRTRLHNAGIANAMVPHRCILRAMRDTRSAENRRAIKRAQQRGRGVVRRGPCAGSDLAGQRQHHGQKPGQCGGAA
jgi:hypothetical protein